MHPRLTLAAAAVATLFAFSAPVFAQEDDGRIVVTATRFSEIEVKIPASVTTISREDIGSSAAANLPELLRSRAGIETVSLFGSRAASTKVDLRGFGETSNNNTLVLVDGQRLNPIDGSDINWAIVPLAAIQRIEIIRGSGAVLYGDRATGGVINIITDKSGREQSSVAIQAGSFGSRQIDANLAGSRGALYYSLHAGHAESDGYRRNNQSDQDNAGGRISVRSASGEGFIDFSAYRDSSGLPGALFSDQYATDPRMARTPNDTQKHTGYRLRPGLTSQVTPTVTVSAEVGLHREDYDYSSPDYVLGSSRETLSLTPRLRWKHGLGAQSSETVVGSDIYRGEITNDSRSTYTGTNQLTARQTSSAVYFQNSTELVSRLTATLGARSQRMNQEANDRAADVGGETTRTRTSSEFGLNWAINNSWRLFGKAGRTWRFPNTDELFGYDPNTYSSLFAGNLQPQRATGREIGTAWNSSSYSGKINAYQQNLKNEIAFNGSTYNNENLPDTRRRGIETELDVRPAKSFRLVAAYTYQEANFRAGPNAGKDLPLIAANKASLTLSWNGGTIGRYDAIATRVGKRRTSGDFDNTLNYLPAYTVADLQATWKTGTWTIGAKVLNAFDKKYSPFGGYSTYYSDYYFYPADGRSIQGNLRYDFK